MAWIVLVIAGILETVWATDLSRAEGFSRFCPSLIFAAALFFSMAGSAHALKTLPVGTGYAVWVGIDAVRTAVVGMVWMGEAVRVATICCQVVLVSAIVGLKVLHRRTDVRGMSRGAPTQCSCAGTS